MWKNATIENLVFTIPKYIKHYNCTKNQAIELIRVDIENLNRELYDVIYSEEYQEAVSKERNGV